MYLISVYLLLIGLVLLLGTVLFAVAVAIVLARAVARLLTAYSRRICTMLFLPHTPMVRRTQVIAYQRAEARKSVFHELARGMEVTMNGACGSCESKTGKLFRAESKTSPSTYLLYPVWGVSV